MTNPNSIQEYNSYLEEILLHYELKLDILNDLREPGFAAERYYAGLRLQELETRLRQNVKYCENTGISCAAYEKARKLLKN
ncbi:MAG: hypothetical protein NTY20_02215 [Candidatus Aenigmarchaeota archaeon]|nr:hypothetical protein [Candidatus Aenigmarchaeota archaeon]